MSPELVQLKAALEAHPEAWPQVEPLLIQMLGILRQLCDTIEPGLAQMEQDLERIHRRATS